MCSHLNYILYSIINQIFHFTLLNPCLSDSSSCAGCGRYAGQLQRPLHTFHQPLYDQWTEKSRALSSMAAPFRIIPWVTHRLFGCSRVCAIYVSELNSRAVFFIMKSLLFVSGTRCHYACNEQRGVSFCRESWGCSGTHWSVPCFGSYFIYLILNFGFAATISLFLLWTFCFGEMTLWVWAHKRLLNL